MDIFITPIIEVIKLVACPIGRQIGYVVHHKRNIDQLLKEMEKLANWKIDVQQLVDAAGRRGESIREVVQNWLQNVEIIQNAVNTLCEESRGSEGCYSPGRVSVRYRVGKEAKKKISVVNDLRNEGKFNDGVSIPPLPPSIDEDFESTMEDMKNIMEKLEILKVDVQQWVDAAERRGESIRAVVRSWLQSVETIQTEMNTLCEKSRGSEGCSSPGRVSVRCRVGKEAKKKISLVKDLLNEGQFNGLVSNPPLPPCKQYAQIEDFEPFASTMEVMKNIKESLKDAKINLIGVCCDGSVHIHQNQIQENKERNPKHREDKDLRGSAKSPTSTGEKRTSTITNKMMDTIISRRKPLL